MRTPINKNKLETLTWFVDDPQDWDIVAEIPDSLGSYVSSCFNQGLNWKQVACLVPEEYRWVPEFMAMYHKSYAQ